MAQKNRTPLHVDPEFREAIKKIRGKLLVSGQDVSMTKLTTIMSKPEVMKEIEKLVLDELGTSDISVALNMIKIDRRKRI